MALRIGTIGVGNAGCQVAELAKVTADIDGLAINSSDRDLSNVKSIPKLKIGDTFGAGKDRTEAKKFIKNSINEFLSLEVVTEFMQDKQVVFIITSIDGGTGSGTTPVLTDILNSVYNENKPKEEKVLFILVPIYLSLRQSAAAHQNAIEFLTEVNNFLPLVPRMSFDNNKLAHLSSDKMIKAINEDIVKKLRVIRGDYNFNTPYTSIDEKDMLKIIEVPGEINIFMLEDFSQVTLESKSIEDALLAQIKSDSLQVAIERDKIVKKIGVISNLEKDINDTFDNSLPKVREFTGQGIEGFEHLYINDGEENDVNRVCVIMSGMTIPDTRIAEIANRIETAKEELLKVKKSSILSKIDTSDISTLRETPKAEAKEVNTEDIFSKYL